MKKLVQLLCICIATYAFQPINAQSFEETSFPNLTTTPTASRSANFIDVNGDGWDDIFITNGPFEGQNNMLYINNTNGTFTTVSGVDIVGDNDRSDGASFADVDNDGDNDAFVVTFGANGQGKKNYFYRNNGDGSFTYEPNIAMGIPLTYSEMATWVDINDDQFLDLYFTNSVGSLTNLYFENQGDGSFQSVTNLTITNEAKPSRSIDWIDYDGDGDCDLFVTNESNQNNTLYRNDGPDNFTQITNLNIVTDNKNSAGSSWGDIDNDGDFDLFVANYANAGQSNQLFINNNGTFTEDTNSAVASAVTNSFGSSFGDVDNDGDLDLFVCNAFLAGQDTNFLYINDGSGNFTLDTNSDLANHQGWTFGSAFGDYNNDGWLDVLLANTLDENQTNSLYKNTGTGNNWVKIICKGTASNASAVGALVRLTATIDGNSVTQIRKVAASSGYCSQNSYANHFGLGDATIIDEIEIQWPAGSTEIFTDIDINDLYAIVEGDGILANEDTNGFTASLFPNPVANAFTVSSSVFTEYPEASISLYGVDGSLVHTASKTHAATNTETMTIDISHLSPGIYFYSIHQNTNILLTGKVVKQ